MRITALEVVDLRFPTSRTLDGSDAVNVDPDYSAAYVILRTGGGGPDGHGLTFTCGRGTEIVARAVESYAPLVVGRTLEEITADFARFWRSLAGESQIRWLGPEKGAIHLALAAIVNALWDLWAKVEGKPLWKLLADLPPERIVSCIDFTHITDALTPEEARAILERAAPTRAERERRILAEGYPAYTTSAGWLGYPDEKVVRLCREAMAQGFTHFKMKVGANLDDDVRRARLVRETIGPGRVLMTDANQKWEVGEAISWMKRLAEFRPWWIEEPTSPDDVLGHATIRRAVAPIGVASGEHIQNRVMFKQFLQAGALDFCQIDSCRLGGVNEILSVLLLAAKFGVPVCPHAGGIGLCEYGQHLSLIDYVCVSGSLERRALEFADHLHEHFVTPVVTRRGRYLPPSAPGFSAEMLPASLEELARDVVSSCYIRRKGRVHASKARRM
jgi:L-fuconate dehydratase